jgi:hypothetical protein
MAMNYIVSIFKSVHEAWVADELTLSLSELETLLTECHITNDKHDNLLFNLAKFKSLDEGAQLARVYHKINGVRQETYDEFPQVRRCKENIVSITGLLLDIDGNHTLESAVKWLDGIHAIFFTTHSHGKIDKFRVVLPFSQPLLAKDFAGRIDSIIETFPGVDHASFSGSQSFYFHSSSSADTALSFVMRGELIDPYQFEEKEIVEYVPQPYNYQPPSDDYQKHILEALLTCRNVHYDSQSGSRNGGVLTLISICRSIGLTYEQFDALCAQICAPDSQLKHKESRRAAWTGWKGDRITWQKRNEFIRANGGYILPPKKQYKTLERVQ